MERWTNTNPNSISPHNLTGVPPNLAVGPLKFAKGLLKMVRKSIKLNVIYKYIAYTSI